MAEHHELSSYFLRLGGDCEGLLVSCSLSLALLSSEYCVGV